MVRSVLPGFSPLANLNALALTQAIRMPHPDTLGNFFWDTS